MPSQDSKHTKVVIYQLLPRLFGNKQTANKLYGTRDENGVGKFNDITDKALQGIRELGTTHVWYTGVLEHALITDYSEFGIPPDDADVVKGRAGSPYSIKDYYDVNPDLAVSVPDRMKEFEDLIGRTHANGMKVILDFVPNHVARAYHSDAKPAGVEDLGAGDDTSVGFKASNNFYYLPGTTFQVPAGYKPLGGTTTPTENKSFAESPAKATGNDRFVPNPSVDDWFETVKLNYGVDIQNGGQKHFDPIPDTWVKMKDILVYWTRKNVDGFRCDMAEMVPVEFWNWAIPQVKAENPNILFIAEIYNPDAYRNYINEGKFDYLYDKVLLYDTLRRIMAGHQSTAGVDEVQQRLKDINAHMLHFMENHDEQRLASRFFAGDMWRGAPAFVISATIDQGPVLVYFGQEVGEPAAGAEGFQGDDGRTTIFDYWGVPKHQQWMNMGAFDGGQLDPESRQLRMLYMDVLHLASTNPAFVEGDYLDLTAFNIGRNNFPANTHAFVRSRGDNKFLVINGFNAQDQEVRIQLSPEAVSMLQLNPEEGYIAHDMLWKEVEVGFDKEWGFNLKMKPYLCLIMKIK